VKLARAAYASAGVVLVGIGLVGVFVPGLPTTVFLIVALFCFKKGSSRLENWLLNHRRFGPTLQDWERHRAIKPRTKLVATGTMWVFIAVSALLIPKLWVTALVVAHGVAGTWYIASRPANAPARPLAEP
jgi:uncharacterized membrane protein YbaN (DUF454 family)